MPAAIPLVASAFAIEAGVAAGIGTLAGGLMTAGGALGAIGTITGNKKLSTLGAVLGLAGGGFSMLGESAGTTAGQSAFNNMSSDIASEIGGASPAASELANTAAETSAVASRSLDAANLSPLADQGGPAMSQWGDAYGAPTPTAPTADGVISQATGGAVQAPAAPASGAPADLYADQAQASLTAPAGAGQNPGGPWEALKDFVKGGADWAQKNPNAAKLAFGGVALGAKAYGDQALLSQQYQYMKSFDDWKRQRYSDAVAALRIPQMYAGTGIIQGSRG